MDEWRDAKGRFVEGWPGGPGRPRRSTEDSMLQEICEQATEAWPDIVKKVIAEALQGKPWAVRFLANYGLGMPQRFVDVTSRGEHINDEQTFDAKVAEIAALINGGTTPEVEGDAGCDLATTDGETPARRVL